MVKTVASEGMGIEECIRAIESWDQRQKGSHLQHERALQLQKERLMDIVRSEIQRSLLRDRRTAERLDQLARLLDERKIDPYSAAEQLLAQLPGSMSGRKDL